MVITRFSSQTLSSCVGLSMTEDKPSFAEVELLANRYLDMYITGQLDRLDVAYTRFSSISKQAAVVETLLPLGSLEGAAPAADPTSTTVRKLWTRCIDGWRRAADPRTSR